MKIQFQTVLVMLFAVAFTPQIRAAQPARYDWAEEIRTLSRPELLPRYRTGCIVEGISSFDPTGGNDDGFSGRYSYIRKENGKLVLADLKGPGVINRIFTPTPTCDTISFYFDGESIPRISLPFEDLFSGKIFPFAEPVCDNEIGGFFCYLPIPYEKSCKIVFSGEKILFHQIQYRNLPGYSVKSFDINDIPTDALDEIRRVWAVPAVPANARVASSQAMLKPGEEIVLYRNNRPGRILGFEIDGGTSFEGPNKDVILSARWDDDQTEAIYAPLQDFFGYAYGKPAMSSILVGNRDGVNYCYMPCPYDRKAEIRLTYKQRKGAKQEPIRIDSKIYYSDQKRDATAEGKFYTVWNREIDPPKGRYYPFAELKGKGHYVGNVHQAQGLIPGMTLFFEGDDSIRVDGVMRIHGTGSEDFYNGGWYAVMDRWDRGMNLPLHGALDYSLPMARTGGYRLCLSDKMSFEHDFYIGIEHGPERNEYPVDYTSVAFYYCDRAPLRHKEPTEKLRTVYQPDKHTFYPQLMDFNLARGLKVSLDDYVRTEVTEHSGKIRINLSEIPEGSYRIYLTYLEKSTGADFRLWQRQNPVTEWKSSRGSEAVHKKSYLGKIHITPQTASLTIEVRENGGAGTFDFECLYLEKDSTPDAIIEQHVQIRSSETIHRKPERNPLPAEIQPITVKRHHPTDIEIRAGVSNRITIPPTERIDSGITTAIAGHQNGC